MLHEIPGGYWSLDTLQLEFSYVTRTKPHPLLPDVLMDYAVPKVHVATPRPPGIHLERWEAMVVSQVERQCGGKIPEPFVITTKEPADA